MPDHDTLSAPALYRRIAGCFDLSTAWLEPYRRRAVSQLRLQPGDVVVDVGCGTGMSFAPIQSAIGPTGRLVGIECSPEMLAPARTRVADAGWDNVTLLEAGAEEAVLPEPADAILFAFTHDVVRSRTALANLLRQMRPGGRLAAAGPKWSALAPHLNPLVWQVARQFVTTFDGFRRPCAELERAKDGPYGAAVAHGFHTLARFTALLGEILTVEGVATTLNYGVNRVRFPAPARVGSRVRMGVEVKSVEQAGDGVQVLYGATFEIEGQAKPACVAEVIFRYYG
jgi:SAM-dependent methyltransferase